MVALAEKSDIDPPTNHCPVRGNVKSPPSPSLNVSAVPSEFKAYPAEAKALSSAALFLTSDAPSMFTELKKLTHEEPFHTLADLADTHEEPFHTLADLAVLNDDPFQVLRGIRSESKCRLG